MIKNLLVLLIVFVGASSMAHSLNSAAPTKEQIAQIETCLKESSDKTQCINIVTKDCVEKSDDKSIDTKYCQDIEIKIWEQLLDRDYNELLQVSTSEEAKALKTTQRDWIKFRDSKCNFDRIHVGSLYKQYGPSCIKYETARQAIWMNDGLNNIDQ